MTKCVQYLETEPMKTLRGLNNEKPNPFYPSVNKSGQISVGEGEGGGEGGRGCAFPPSIIDCLEDSNALMATHVGDMDICMFCWSHEAHLHLWKGMKNNTTHSVAQHHVG